METEGTVVGLAWGVWVNPGDLFARESGRVWALLTIGLYTGVDTSGVLAKVNTGTVRVSGSSFSMVRSWKPSS